MKKPAWTLACMFFLAVPLCLAIVTGQAQAEGLRFEWAARIAVSEQYDDNVDLAATNKHVMGGCYYPEKVAEIKRLGVIIAGGEEAYLERPFLSFNLGWMVSPLRFATETTETLTEAIRSGIPVALVSAPQAGATAPAASSGR